MTTRHQTEIERLRREIDQQRREWAQAEPSPQALLGAVKGWRQEAGRLLATLPDGASALGFGAAKAASVKSIDAEALGQVAELLERAEAEAAPIGIGFGPALKATRGWRAPLKDALEWLAVAASDPEAPASAVERNQRAALKSHFVGVKSDEAEDEGAKAAKNDMRNQLLGVFDSVGIRGNRGYVRNWYTSPGTVGQQYARKRLPLMLAALKRIVPEARVTTQDVIPNDGPYGDRGWYARIEFVMPAQRSAKANKAPFDMSGSRPTPTALRQLVPRLRTIEGLVTAGRYDTAADQLLSVSRALAQAVGRQLGSNEVNELGTQVNHLRQTVLKLKLQPNERMHQNNFQRALASAIATARKLTSGKSAKAPGDYTRRAQVQQATALARQLRGYAQNADGGIGGPALAGRLQQVKGGLNALRQDVGRISPLARLLLDASQSIDKAIRTLNGRGAGTSFGAGDYLDHAAGALESFVARSKSAKAAKAVKIDIRNMSPRRVGTYSDDEIRAALQEAKRIWAMLRAKPRDELVRLAQSRHRISSISERDSKNDLLNWASYVYMQPGLWPALEEEWKRRRAGRRAKADRRTHA